MPITGKEFLEAIWGDLPVVEVDGVDLEVPVIDIEVPVIDIEIDEKP